MTSSTQLRAIIAGGSVGGLFAGNLLVRQGWQVDIFERASSGLDARGAGIAGHDELTAILLAYGLTRTRLKGIEVTGRTAIDRDGGLIAHFDYPQCLTSWNIVFNLLHDAFPQAHYHLGVEVRSASNEGDHASVVLSDGRTLKADLVIGADGIRSRVRACVAPKITPAYAGYVAWRGIMNETDLSAAFMAESFDKFTFCWPPYGQFIGYPVPGADSSIEPGSRRYSYLWYRGVGEGETIESLLTDDTGHVHENSIPPPLIQARHIEAVRRDAMRALPPSYCEVVLAAERNLLQPIFDIESRQIAFGRIALLGDAAFVARPHVGVGVLKAGQDAVALAAALETTDSVPQALRRYESERLQPGIDAVAFGRHLGSFIERGLPGPQSDPDLGLTFEYIIRESARLPRREAFPRAHEGALS